MKSTDEMRVGNPVLVPPPEDARTPTSLPVIKLQPSRGWVALQLRDLWEYRELLYFLAWRDIKVRYKQTALGAGWAVLQPFLTMVVFSIFFGHLARMPSDGVPYPVFTYAALVPWTFFANAMTISANSLVGNSQLVSKVYFPRLIIPIAGVLSGLLDFLLAFVVLIGMMAWFGIYVSPRLLVLPACLLLAVIASLGVGLWLAALNVEFRDVRYTLPFLTQIWLFATPIAYPSTLVHGWWRFIYGLNPMVGVVEGFRWALLGSKVTLGPSIVASSIVSLLLLVTGALYFRRMERTFADVV